MKKQYLLPAIQFCGGVLLVIAGRWLLPVCEFKGMRVHVEGGGSVPMKCLFTHEAIALVGILVILNTAMELIFDRVLHKPVLWMRILLYLSVFYLAYYAPGVCAGPSMPCVSGTRPLWTAIASIGIFLTAFQLFLLKSSGPGDRP